MIIALLCFQMSFFGLELSCIIEIGLIDLNPTRVILKLLTCPLRLNDGFISVRSTEVHFSPVTGINAPQNLFLDNKSKCFSS